MIVALLATALALATPGLAQEYFDGPCPTPNVEYPFDLGGAFSQSKWYEYSKYKSDFLEGSGDCITWEFTARTGTHERSKIVTELVEGSINRKVKTMESEIWLKDRNREDGDFNYKVTKQKDGWPVWGTYEYEIINYDETNDKWAVAWSCKNENFNRHQELVWILTRDRHPAHADVAAALDGAQEQGLSIRQDLLRVTKQDSCVTAEQQETTA